MQNTVWGNILQSLSAAKKQDEQWLWDMVDSEKDEFQKYLAVDVDCVQLPRRNRFDLYPFVVLDGASGTGKTQQAIALLKAGGMQRGMVYVNFFSDQPIYADLNTVFKQDTALIDTTVDQLSAAGVSFNVADLQKSVENNDISLQPLVDHLKKSIRYCDIGNNILQYRGSQVLNDHILFIDEALSGTSEACHNRLRFLRNLGRALKMRVVVAGTSATTVNFLEPPAIKTHRSSRQNVVEGAWAVVIFLRHKHVNFNPLEHHPHLQKLLSEGRPWLVNISREMGKKTGFARDTILYIAVMINEQKKAYDDDHVDPLLLEQSGAWLKGNFVAPLPFWTQSEQLIKMAFFEPSIRVIMGDHSTPDFGIGMAKVTQKDGPLRMVVQRMQTARGLRWALGHRKEMFNRRDATMEEAEASYITQVGVAKKFEDIQDIFRCCVQQCLALEPVLALAMTVVAQQSIWPRLKSGLQISRIFRPSNTQWTKGEVDGESFEHIARIVVQLASWQAHQLRRSVNQEPSLRGGEKSLNNFLSDIFTILISQGSASDDEAYENMCGLKKIGVPNAFWAKRKSERQSWDKLVKPLVDNAVIGPCLESFKVPWLVSACDTQRLREVMLNNPELESLDIAGLIPQPESNSYLDNTVLRWTAKPEDEIMFLEYKSRRGTYSANEALGDLKAKMDNHFKASVSREINDLAAGIMSVVQTADAGIAEMTAKKADVNDVTANRAGHASITALRKRVVADEIKAVTKVANAAVEAVKEAVVAGDMSAVTEVVDTGIKAVTAAAHRGKDMITSAATASAASYIETLEDARDACILAVVKAAAADAIKAVAEAANDAKRSLENTGKYDVSAVNRAVIAGFQDWMSAVTDMSSMEPAHKLFMLVHIETIKAKTVGMTKQDMEAALQSLYRMDTSIPIRNEVDQAAHGCARAMRQAANIGDIEAAHEAAIKCALTVETAVEKHIKTLGAMAKADVDKINAMLFSGANPAVGLAASKKAKKATAAFTMALNRATAAEKATATNKEVALRCMVEMKHAADAGIAAVTGAATSRVAGLQHAQEGVRTTNAVILKQEADAAIEAMQKKAAVAGMTAPNQEAAVRIATEKYEAALHKGNKSKVAAHLKEATSILKPIQIDSEAIPLEESKTVDRVCLLIGISGATKNVMGANLYERTIHGKITTELHIALVMGLAFQF